MVTQFLFDTVDRCHSGFVPPRQSSGGTNSLADTFRRKEYASVHIRPDNLRDRVSVPARANVPLSKMCYSILLSLNFSISLAFKIIIMHGYDDRLT